MALFNNANRNRDYIDEVILKIVKAMQPITAENIWYEFGEILDNESKMHLSEIEKRLEKMKSLEKLDLICAGNKKVTYWKIKEQ